ncbi:transcriptional regulator with XRE-family HTH domain [Chryseobacterium sediminis]|uniref:Transcriptional regulator with XRE-family HTH domain n=1 Tax=Chryseobacterium sediminis TaxID=1679494 RepID=A0ABR6Q640_9FLAO|nr:helix-turn-helix transcriptional regulator [Chryseobacterium sediminis]MBB6332988.1 transcriptional regulator with XRE-family HTH domain [Chryseobacterium sediminis]
MEKSEILKLIGKRIKELRMQKGISQADLVGRMEGNIDPTNISRIEAGRTNPTIITLYRIAEALEIKLIDLLNIEASER